MHLYTVCIHLTKENATSIKFEEKLKKRNYYIVSGLKINTREE